MTFDPPHHLQKCLPFRARASLSSSQCSSSRTTVATATVEHYADTLTSRSEMAGAVPAAAAEAVAVPAGGRDGDGDLTETPGSFLLVGALPVWNRTCCKVRRRFGCSRCCVWWKTSTATHFITPTTRSSYSGTVYILEVCGEEVLWLPS